MTWQEEFREEYCKGGDWVAPNMKGEYVIQFISKLLEQQRNELVKELEGMRKTITSYDDWVEIMFGVMIPENVKDIYETATESRSKYNQALDQAIQKIKSRQELQTCKRYYKEKE